MLKLKFKKDGYYDRLNNNNIFSVMAIKDNSTDYYDQIYLSYLAENVPFRLKLKYQRELYTIPCHKDSHTEIPWYSQCGANTEKLEAMAYTDIPTLAYKYNNIIYYCVKDVQIKKKTRIQFVDSEDNSKSLVKFYDQNTYIDIFLETESLFAAHPEKGISYWERNNGVKYTDPVYGNFVTPNEPEDITLTAYYVPLNKPFNGVTLVGPMGRSQITGEANEYIYNSTSTGGGGSSSGGGT